MSSEVCLVVVGVKQKSFMLAQKTRVLKFFNHFKGILPRPSNHTIYLSKPENFTSCFSSPLQYLLVQIHKRHAIIFYHFLQLQKTNYISSGQISRGVHRESTKTSLKWPVCCLPYELCQENKVSNSPLQIHTYLKSRVAAIVFLCVLTKRNQCIDFHSFTHWV